MRDDRTGVNVPVIIEIGRAGFLRDRPAGENSYATLIRNGDVRVTGRRAVKVSRWTARASRHRSTEDGADLRVPQPGAEILAVLPPPGAPPAHTS